MAEEKTYLRDLLSRTAGTAKQWGSDVVDKVSSSLRNATVQNAGKAVGGAAGQTVNAAEAVVDKVDEAAKAAGEGFKEARGATQPVDQFEAKRAAAAEKAWAEMRQSPLRESLVKAPGTGVVPYDPVQGNRFGPSAGPEPMGRSIPPQGSAPPGVSSPYPPNEGYKHTASGAIEPDDVKPQSEKTGVRQKFSSGAGKLLKGAGVLAAGAAGVDAVDQTMAGKTPEQQMGVHPWIAGNIQAVDNLMFGRGRELFGGIGGAMRGATVDSQPGIGNRLRGAVEGFRKGWNTMEEAEQAAAGEPIQTAKPEQPAKTEQSTQPVAPAQTPAEVQAAAQRQAITDNARYPYVPMEQLDTNQGKMTPEQLVSGTALPASGQGAIKFGNRPAIGMRTSGSDIIPQQVQQRPRGINSTALFSGRVGSPTGALSALQAFGAGSRLLKNEGEAQRAEKELGLKGQANRIAAAKAAYDIDKDRRDFQVEQEKRNSERREKQIEKWATRITPPRETGVMGGEKEADYQARVKRKGAEFSRELDYTVGNRKDGKKISQLTDTEMERYALAKKVKDKVEQARSKAAESIKDLFGDKRFDSDDLHSYMPSSANSTVMPFQGGYSVTLENGNTMYIKNAKDGGFNLTGPNDPSDADLMALFKPVIDEFKRKRKGNK